jgi:outer membrane protein assembly factor BamB
VALIELDRTARPDQTPSSLPPTRRYRATGLIVAIVLALAAGGAASPGPPLWRYLGAVPVNLGAESPFQLDGARLYTSTGLDAGRTVTAWDLTAAPPARLWSTSFPAHVLGPDEVAFGAVSVTGAGDVVLLSDGPQVTAVDAGTGARRWQEPISVRPLGGDRIGLEQDPQFRAGTLYDDDSGQPGSVYISATGEPHSEPPVSTRLRGIDLRTGQATWSVSEPGSVQVLTIGAGLLVLGSDRLVLRSPRTGQVLRRVTLTAINGHPPASGEVDGDAVVVTYGSDELSARALVAYDAGSLRERWRRAETPQQERVGSCTGVICADAPGGREVLDRATGRTLWQVPATMDLDRYGTDVVETLVDEPLRVVDPVNGDPRLRLTTAAVTKPGDGPLLLRRALDNGRAAFDLVQDDPAAVRPLGETRTAVSTCSAGDNYVVCQAAGEVQAYAYRS